MKALIVLLLLCTSCILALAQNAPTMTDDEEIKATIVGETTAWANRDSVAFMNYYASDAVTQQVYNNRDGSYGVSRGFETIENTMRKYFRNSPAVFYKNTVERTDWLIKILSPEWAWVNFVEKITTVKNEIHTSYESRLMKKENNQWKIAVVNALGDYKNVVKQ